MADKRTLSRRREPSLTCRGLRPKWPLLPNTAHRQGVVVAFLAGAVAQLGERLVRNEEVSGSIPLGSTNLRQTLEEKCV